MIRFIVDSISFFFYLLSFLNPFHMKGKKVILVYHSVSDSEPRLDKYRMNISVKLFEKHMKYISGLKEKDSIEVTFDDGFENFFYHAYPVVKAYGIPTTLFIVVDFVDGKTPLKALSWEQIKEIQNWVEIGSHTTTHPNLRDLDEKHLYDEIQRSKAIIENNIGKSIQSFAYPFGAKQTFDERVKKITKEAGYTRAYTNIMGFNDRSTDPFELHRMRVYSNDQLFRFRMKLRGAYNWIDLVNKIRPVLRLASTIG